MAIKDVSVILNQIRATSSSAYQTAVPLATATNIEDVGKAVLALPSASLNEFIHALNKTALTTISSVDYTNPFIFLKKQSIQDGATVEDLFIEMAVPHQYVAGTREGDTVPDQFAIFKLMNKAGFYSTQLERQYGMTIHKNDMRRAFRSVGGVEQFISNMYNAVKSGEERDDYIMTVALMARQIEQALTETPEVWKGEVKLITLFNATVPVGDQVNAGNALQSKLFLTFMANQFKKWSTRLTFLRRDLNFAGVENYIPASRQRIMMLADIQADLDTHLYATAYNQERLEIGGFDAIDAWYSIGRTGGDTPSSLPESISIKSIVKHGDSKVIAVIYDPEMLKIHNKFREADVANNARGHYFNTFTTVADIYAASPFTNFVVFTLE